MATRHIRNYAKVRRMIDAYFVREFAEVRRMKAEDEELLKRVRAGERNVRTRNGREAKEDELVGSIAHYGRRLDESLYRGKPKKGTLLKWKWEMIADLDAADRASKFTGMKVKIEWRRSRTWGHNPSAEVWVFSDGGGTRFPMRGSDGKQLVGSDGKPYVMTTWYRTGHASGCGYDKGSASIQDGIGSCPTIARMIIENERCWECYAVDGKNSLPHLSIGGKGVETLRALFKAYGEKPPIPGFNWNWEGGRSWDLIEVSPKGKTA